VPSDRQISLAVVESPMGQRWLFRRPTLSEPIGPPPPLDEDSPCERHDRPNRFFQSVCLFRLFRLQAMSV